MKIGSIVFYVAKEESFHPQFKEAAIPRNNIPYTVRDLDGTGGIRLEEIDNSHIAHLFVGNIEPFFKVELFREIEFPPSLELEIKEALTKELVDG